MQGLNVKLVLEAIDKMTAPVRRMAGSFSKSMKDMGHHVEEFGKKFKQLGREIDHIGKFFMERFTLPITGFGALALHEAGNIEELKNHFMGLAGGAKQAGDLVKRLSAFSQNSPFKMDDVAQAATQIMGMGTSADGAFKRFQFIGNTAVVAGKSLNEMATSYENVRLKGTASMDDLMELNRAGVPIVRELGKQMHMTDRRVLEMAENGEVSFMRYKKALESMSATGGATAGAMKRAADGINGSFTRFVETAKQAFSDIGDEIFHDLDLKNVMNKVIADINGMVKWFLQLPKPIKSTIIWVVLLVAAFGPLVFIIGQMFMGFGLITMGLGLLMSGIAAIIPAIITLGTALLTTPVGWFLAAIAAIAFVAYELVKHWGKVSGFFKGLWGGIKSTFNEAITWLLNKIQPLMDAIADVQQGWGAFKDFAVNNPVSREVTRLLAPGANGAPAATTSQDGTIPSLPIPAAPVGMTHAPQRVDTGGTLNIKIDSDGNAKDAVMKPNDPRVNFTVSSGRMMESF